MGLRTKESRGKTDEDATVHEMKPRKKAAAKKVATKRTTGKKAASRKPHSA